ncbi:MAG: hypothetical protein AAF842_08675 [Planctomycetota bacterium]
MAEPEADRTQDIRRWWLAGAVVLVFVVSLFLPVFYRSDGTHVAPGWAALVYGWMAVHPAWLANPLWLAGLILLGCKRYLVAAIIATLGVLLALSTFSLVGAKMWTGDLTVLAISAGYYAWLASQLILAGGAFVLWRTVGRHHRQA